MILSDEPSVVASRKGCRMKVSVIMPVFNEEGTIGEIVRRVLAVPLDMELLIVDDASSDRTAEEILKLVDPRIRAFRHPRNRGKGAAIRTAIPHATGDVIVIQDADLEYDPAQIPTLLQPIEEDVADVVYGSRFLGGPHRVHLFWHYVANQMLTALSNLLNNLNLTDMETCYKCVRRPLLQEIRLRSDRFTIEPEITAKLARKGARFHEVADQLPRARLLAGQEDPREGRNRGILGDRPLSHLRLRCGLPARDRAARVGPVPFAPRRYGVRPGERCRPSPRRFPSLPEGRPVCLSAPPGGLPHLAGLPAHCVSRS